MTAAEAAGVPSACAPSPRAPHASTRKIANSRAPATAAGRTGFDQVRPVLGATESSGINMRGAPWFRSPVNRVVPTARPSRRARSPPRMRVVMSGRTSWTASTVERVCSRRTFCRRSTPGLASTEWRAPGSRVRRETNCLRPQPRSFEENIQQIPRRERRISRSALRLRASPPAAASRHVRSWMPDVRRRGRPRRS